jgi:hypothetical protein
MSDPAAVSGDPCGPAERRRPADGPVGLVRRNLAAALGAAALTAAVQLAVFGAARSAMGSAAGVVALAAGLLWVTAAAPVFAATGRRWPDALLRGAAAADGSGVLLIVLAAGGEGIGWRGAAGIYLLWLTVAAAGSAAAALASDRRGRFVAAAVAAAVLAATAATPFWSNAAVMSAPPGWSARAAWLAEAVNPAYATFSCLRPASGFVWHERPIHYAWSALGRDVTAPAAGWWPTAIIFAAATCVLVLAGQAIGRRGGVRKEVAPGRASA